MASTVLIAYATKHDSTHQVAEFLATILRQSGLVVDVRAAADVEDVMPYEGVVLGGALYMGRWHRDARRMLREHRAGLHDRPLFVFAMGPVALDEESVASARRQLEHALSRVPDVHPADVAIFGGVVHPDELGFPLNRMAESDARDPAAITAWAGEIARTLTARELPAAPL
jgi:menaquinone-dependent protoporphyrinogen oxidase